MVTTICLHCKGTVHPIPVAENTLEESITADFNGTTAETRIIPKRLGRVSSRGARGKRVHLGARETGPWAQREALTPSPSLLLLLLGQPVEDGFHRGGHRGGKLVDLLHKPGNRSLQPAGMPDKCTQLCE